MQNKTDIKTYICNLLSQFEYTFTFIIMVILSSCNDSGIRKEINYDHIKGKWYLDQWTTYHTLIFSDSTVFVDNNIDTVFSLNYSFLHDTLITWANPDTKFRNKIILLSADSLILDGIGRASETRNYSRIKTQ